MGMYVDSQTRETRSSTESSPLIIKRDLIGQKIRTTTHWIAVKIYDSINGRLRYHSHKRNHVRLETVVTYEPFRKLVQSYRLDAHTETRHGYNFVAINAPRLSCADWGACERLVSKDVQTSGFIDFTMENSPLAIPILKYLSANVCVTQDNLVASPV